MNLRVEIWQPETCLSQQEIVLRDDTVRAVEVPFSISNTSKGAMLSTMLGTVNSQFRFGPSENFALVFEIKLRNDLEYLNSSQYREDVEQGFTQECSRLTFYAREEPVQPEVLRMDSWESPPYLFSRYTSLNPTYPLILDDEPTEVLRW